MTATSYSEINDDVLSPIRPPRPAFWAVMSLFAIGALWAGICWVYQAKAGMGVTGLNIPVGWAVYITNFVFWVGIAHSGTLISAILHLVRSRWRTAVSRSAEAMTIFAVMTAGLFPLIHLGRIWVFYYIIPYPSERQIWPNPLSPLFWDFAAVSTYLTVSTIFWFVGGIPDLASTRDRMARTLGPDSAAAKAYGKLALGWDGSGHQWRHHGRAYLFFAALATPLVVSVHSVVSWDFAVGLLPGWHTTIFAPYFVAGAIHSGLAMVLTLLIPLRRLLRLDRLIGPQHFNAVALTMLVTTSIMAYTYVLEPFIAWYSGDIYERQLAMWRASSWMAPLYWALWLLNALIPLLFVFRRVRHSITALFIISILVNVGMWLERYVIIVSSLSHGFLPHAWSGYGPSIVEISITAGSFCFFLALFFLFTRAAPTVAISDVKEDQLRDEKMEVHPPADARPPRSVRGATAGLIAMYASPQELLAALGRVVRSPFERYETYSPMRLEEGERLMGRGPSPVRYWTLIGALLGLAGGFALAIGMALRNSLISGGKHPVSIVPYCVIGFEGTILLGTIGNLIGLIVHSRLGRRQSPSLPLELRERFTRDQFGLFIACPAKRFDEARELLSADAVEVRELGA